MEGLFEILAQIPKDRLLRFERQLSRAEGGRRACGLLRTMVLLSLHREAEARGSLDALGYDPVAAQIYRSHRSHATAGPGSDPEVALAVAQIYALLAGEELCPPEARDQAYRAAARALGQCPADPSRLCSLVDEAWEKSGQAVAGTLSGIEAWSAGSCPVPTPLSPDPRSLRSTGTPLSAVSHFEISPATTAAWGPASDRGPDAETQGSRDPDDPAERPSPEPPGPRSSSRGDGTPSHTHASRVGVPGPPGPDPDPDPRPAEQDPPPPLPPSPKPPKAAEEPPAAGGGLAGPPDAPTGLQPTSLKPPKSAEGPSPPTPERGAERPNDPSPAPPTGSSPGDEPRFFSFVVLHAAEDEAVACRVKADLEQLGVPDGATYCEDFLVPGRVQLDCFQEALDNSAFTLLLLTERFRSRFCAYQTSVALMDSFQRFRKSNTVVPFLPRESPIPAGQMPTVLAGLVPLEESSPVYRKRVQNTFTARTLREKRAAWLIEARRRQQERDRAYQEMLRSLEGLTGPGGHLPPPYLPTAGGGPFAPSADHPSLSQPYLLSAGGLQPQFIIQNAQMIQIGDYNRMQAERARPAAGEDAEEE